MNQITLSEEDHLRQVSLNIVRDEAVRIAQEIHNNDYSPRPDRRAELVDTTIPHKERDVPVIMSVYTVQNFMNPDMYGATILIEHYHFFIDDANGFVDFEVPLLEVTDIPLITPEQVKIVRVDDKLLRDVARTLIQKQISVEWNK